MDNLNEKEVMYSKVPNQQDSNVTKKQSYTAECSEVCVRSDYVLSLLLISISMGLGAPNVIDLDYIVNNHKEQLNDIKNDIIDAYKVNNINVDDLNLSDIDKLYHESIVTAYDYYRNIEPSSAAWKIALDLKDIAKRIRNNSYVISYYLLMNYENYNGKLSIP